MVFVMRSMLADRHPPVQRVVDITREIGATRECEPHLPPFNIEVATRQSQP
jgi:hypothetical protein